MRVLQHSVGATNLILHHCRTIFEDFHPGILLIFDELGDNPVEVFDDFLLVGAKRVLVRNLEKISECFGALSVKPADSQADFIGSLDGLVDLFAED